MTQYSQSNPEDKEQSRRHNPPETWSSTTEQQLSDNVVLAQKQTYGSMEQKRVQ